MNKIQAIILDIFIEIKRICDKYSIRYYAIGGTALGAERHHGFIPWDDDLDIAMPNSDFERFIDCCKHELPPNLSLFLPDQSNHSLIYFAKVHNNKTSFIEESTFKWVDYHYGIFVDIMPMYGLPNDLNNYCRKVKKYRLLSSLQRNDPSQLSFKKKLLWFLLKPINLLLPKNYWLKKLKSYQSKFDFDKCDKTGYTWADTSRIPKFVFERRWFDDYYELPFETTSIKCCSGNKNCLNKIFGDYLQLPPIEKRKSNHYVKIIDLNNSYKKYNCKGELIDEEK